MRQHQKQRAPRFPRNRQLDFWHKSYHKLKSRFATLDPNEEEALNMAVGKHNDGHLFMVGKGATPLFLVALLLGPTEDESLRAFFQQYPCRFSSLFKLDPPQPWPWYGVCDLPLAEDLSEAERKEIYVGILHFVERLQQEHLDEEMLN